MFINAKEEILKPSLLEYFIIELDNRSLVHLYTFYEHVVVFP